MYFKGLLLAIMPTKLEPISYAFKSACYDFEFRSKIMPIMEKLSLTIKITYVSGNVRFKLEFC